MSLRNGIRRLKAATLPTDAPTMCCGDATTLYGVDSDHHHNRSNGLCHNHLLEAVCFNFQQDICKLRELQQRPMRLVNCVHSLGHRRLDFFGLNVTTTVTGAVPVVTSVVVPTATTTVPCSKRDISDEGEELLKRNAAQPPLRIATKTGLALGALVLSAFVLV
ncbi:SubName: Full=Uncharacterized protein {ECO:0000313/EMBL:CCA67993.1} [Serendipita indica DSM 11827]|nr:SubName: Full=Uncharacterized protein {ECO:0000313/EMBL:CCA67993.1} [Serendipita indica DSM 11827]